MSRNCGGMCFSLVLFFLAGGAALGTETVMLRLGPISLLSQPPGPALVPAAAVDQEGKVHVLWSGGGKGNFEIYYRRVEAGQKTPVRRLSETPGLSSGPKVAALRGSVYAVWHDSTLPRTRLCLRRSRDGGQSFDPMEIVTPSTRGAFTPSMAVDSGGRIHLVWADKSSGQMEVLYSRSHDEGRLWTRPRNFSSNEGKSLVSGVAVDSCGGVYVAWHDDSPGQFEIFLRTSQDAGESFGPAVNLSSSPGPSGAPALATIGCETVYIAWPDDTSGNLEVLARRTTDGGKTFGPVANLSRSAEMSIRPVLAVGQRKVHLSWVDGTRNRFQVFYRCVAPDLKSVSARARLSSGSGLAGAPALTLGKKGKPQVVWTASEGRPFAVFSREVAGCR